jgi:hypothetical protein
LQAAISQVNATVDASKIDGEKMEIRDMVGGSNTLETRQRSGRNRRREKKRKGRSADAAERKKTTQWKIAKRILTLVTWSKEVEENF